MRSRLLSIPLAAIVVVLCFTLYNMRNTMLPPMSAEDIMIAQLTKHVQVDKASLPECKRTFLYKFTAIYGFGSELKIYLSAASIAAHAGYQVLYDDSDWNYGKLSDYFDTPDPLPCRPPADWRTLQRVDLNDPHWTSSDHVYMSRLGYENTYDAYLNEHLVSDEAKGQIRQWTLGNKQAGMRPFLPREQACAPAMLPLYLIQSNELRRIWKPNAAIRDQIVQLSRALRSVQNDTSNEAQSIIGAHFRLGDKYIEAGSDGGASSTPFGITKSWMNPGGYIGIMNEMHSDSSNLLVAIVSDDNRQAKALFAQAEESAQFPAKMISTEDLEELQTGFDQTQFNHIGLDRRITLTQTLVRDLTFFSLFADGFICSASSNVCHMAFLLAGQNRAIDNPVVRSVDQRWFPTLFAYTFD